MLGGGRHSPPFTSIALSLRFLSLTPKAEMRASSSSRWSIVP